MPSAAAIREHVESVLAMRIPAALSVLSKSPPELLAYRHRGSGHLIGWRVAIRRRDGNRRSCVFRQEHPCPIRSGWHHGTRGDRRVCGTLRMPLIRSPPQRWELIFAACSGCARGRLGRRTGSESVCRPQEARRRENVPNKRREVWLRRFASAHGNARYRARGRKAVSDEGQS